MVNYNTDVSVIYIYIYIYICIYNWICTVNLKINNYIEGFDWNVYNEIVSSL